MKRKTYPTDLSDEQWKLLCLMLPPPELPGRKRSVDLREIFNALCYLARSGCQWRLLPKELPAWQTGYYYFRLWRDAECFVVLNDRLREKIRLRAGKQASPRRRLLIRNLLRLTNKPHEAATRQVKRSKGASVIFWLIRSACS